MTEDFQTVLQSETLTISSFFTLSYNNWSFNYIHKCLSYGFHCCNKRPWPKRKLGKKVHYRRISEQELKHYRNLKGGAGFLRSWRGAVYSLASHGLFNLLSLRIQDHPPLLIINRESAFELHFMEVFAQLKLILFWSSLVCVN